MFLTPEFLPQVLQVRKALLGYLIRTISSRTGSDAATGLAFNTTRNLADFKQRSVKLSCCPWFCPFVTVKKSVKHRRCFQSCCTQRTFFPLRSLALTQSTSNLTKSSLASKRGLPAAGQDSSLLGNIRIYRPVRAHTPCAVGME